VHVVGAPGLDNLHRSDLPDRATLEAHLGLDLSPPLVLVTMHPATLVRNATEEAEAVAAAMDLVEATYVITLPNSDAGASGSVRRCMEQAASRPRRVAVDALGEMRYWALMRMADAMLGNSSSGLIEAPAVGLPVVNVGERQRGRVRGGNVLDAPAEASAIADALRTALSPSFRQAARLAPSPFGSGDSAQRILAVLRKWTPPKPPVKSPIPV
jgi:UDP-N-acetylglucosamine 2-epimerase (non-hydrolysing)/GDP/UDP-N,N'-diacetylbacillosamine 2-epimerase (hydrolysing)